VVEKESPLRVDWLVEVIGYLTVPVTHADRLVGKLVKEAEAAGAGALEAEATTLNGGGNPLYSVVLAINEQAQRFSR